MYNSKKVQQQAYRRLKQRETDLIEEINGVKGIDASILSLNNDDIDKLQALLVNLKSFNHKRFSYENKGYVYKLNDHRPVNKPLLERLKSKYKDKDVEMKYYNDCNQFKKEIIKKCSSSILYHDKILDSTIEKYYDNINIYPKMIRFKKIEPEVSDSEDEPEDIFNGIANN
jgi:hemerythrin